MLESSFLHSVGISLGKQIICFILVKSHQEVKYSVIKSVKLLLVLIIKTEDIQLFVMNDFYFIELNERIYISRFFYIFLFYFTFTRLNKSHLHDKKLNFLFIIYKLVRYLGSFTINTDFFTLKALFLSF